MSETRSWGSTVLGWFIVRDQAGADAGTGIAPTDEMGAAPGSADVFKTAPPPVTEGRVDFEGVFDSAGIDPDARGRVLKAGELLASLPGETPVAVRKQIVEASLKAFGVVIDKIIETGVEEIQALEGYIRAGSGETQALLAESNRRIQQHEDEIKTVRAAMEARVREQQSATTACNAKKLEIQRVLEFFGQEAVARVVRESPKLVDPAAPPGGAAS
jgi:hypothetical protein